MPQEHYVLKCFSCETFQAQIVKKVQKWECKMCGAKQSVKRNYGKGSGKDCRIHVMKLNELRFINDSKTNSLDVTINEEDLELPQDNEDLKQQKPFISKWTKYLEEPEANSESEIEESEPDFCAIEDKKSKKRMKKNIENCFSNKKICRASKTSETTSVDKTNYVSQPFIQKNSEKSSKTYENITKNNSIQTNLKVGKYAKYLENEEENELESIND